MLQEHFPIFAFSHHLSRLYPVSKFIKKTYICYILYLPASILPSKK
nr:MAG TPA: hypothetical protein [Caudoviricetes sp.]